MHENTLAPKVSIIVPVYNTEAYLAECLDSALAQTLENLEVICVNDGSTDSSTKILADYAARDARVRVLTQEKNCGTLQARKDGVAASHGEYIMFLDSDDVLVPKACETAYEAIVTTGTDMLQFGTEIVNCAHMPQARIDSNARMLEPCMERIQGDDEIGLLGSCWVDKRFSFQLWNKIYRGDLCRKAFEMMEDERFSVGENLYAFFFLASCARSYSGIKDQLYQYQFGRGRTGKQLFLSSYTELLTERNVANALRRFAANHANASRLMTIIDSIEQHFLDECISKWRTDLASNDKAVGFDRLVATWGYEDVICTLAENNWFDCLKVLRDMERTTYLHHIKRPATKRLTVAYYYRCISNGGAQRVAAELCNIWAAMQNEAGEPLYRVVLITDDAPTEDEYPLDATVTRCSIPAREQFTKGDYRARFKAWQHVLHEEQVDIVVYGQWVDACATWDMLSIKGHPSKPAFVMHCHNFTVLPYRWPSNKAATLASIYRLCDGAAVLSECDRELVGCFNANTHYIVNPLSYIANNRRTCQPEPHAIVWAGRISKEKQPLDLVRMMPAVARHFPDAKLHIVGSSDELLTKQLENEIEQLGLSQNVVLEGFTLDVASWYQQAEVFVCTSEYEGFPLTIGEALSCETPVVMYDLPWLTFVQDGRGIRSVEQGRYDLLATEVIDLLEHPDMARAMGKAGREHINELCSVDLGAEWALLFNSIDPDAAPVLKGTNEQVLLHYLTDWQEQAKASLRHQHNADAKLISTLRKPSELDRLSTARIDLRNMGSNENNIVIKHISDPRAATRQMTWFTEGGLGYLAESRAGKLELHCECVGSGTLEMALRGVDVRGDDGQHVPYWIDFTSLAINNKEQLEVPVAVWHNNPRKFLVPVEDGTVVTISAAWRPHAEAERDAAQHELATTKEQLATAQEQLTNTKERLTAAETHNTELQIKAKNLAAKTKTYKQKIEQLKQQTKQLRQEKRELTSQNKKLRSQLQKAKDLNERRRASASWKIGRAITWLPRHIRNLFRRK